MCTPGVHTWALLLSCRGTKPDNCVHLVEIDQNSQDNTANIKRKSMGALCDFLHMLNSWETRAALDSPVPEDHRFRLMRLG